MSSVKGEFHNGKEVKIKDGPCKGEWQLYMVRPKPNNDISKIVFDIINDNEIIFDNSSLTLKHDNSCIELNHSMSKKMNKALSQLDDEVYKFAIKKPPHYNLPNEYRQQALVIILEPKINFEYFPTHPHLNNYLNLKFPTTICYTTTDAISNMSLDEKIIFAKQQTVIWLLRHMIWKKLGKNNSDWIGNQQITQREYQYMFLIDIYGPCRCGSNKKYNICCLKKDIIKYCNIKNRTNKFGVPYLTDIFFESFKENLYKKYLEHVEYENNFITKLLDYY